jgi:hypothetical protein
MKYITLINSDKRATVDDEDFEAVNQFEWRLKDGVAVTDDEFGNEVEMGAFVLHLASLKNN